MARQSSAPCAGRHGSACWRDRRRRCSRRRYSPAPKSCFCSGIGLEPAEAIDGLATRIIFAADEAGIAEPVELIEQERIVQLFAIGLVARGDAGDLGVADD